MSDTLDDETLRGLRERAAREWFGFGRWGAPYWFIGMEPGGDDCPEIYTSWYQLGATSLLDAKEHEQDYNKLVPTEQQTRFFAKRPKIQQWTWQPLIHITLGFTGSDEDSHIYQRDRFGSASDEGEMAVLELSAIAAKTFVFADQAKYQAGRIISLRHLLVTHEPTIAVFYGLGYSEQYEKIAGGEFKKVAVATFDEVGFCQSGKTLCVLIPHPVAVRKPYDEWHELGIRLALKVG